MIHVPQFFIKFQAILHRNNVGGTRWRLGGSKKCKEKIGLPGLMVLPRPGLKSLLASKGSLESLSPF